MNSLTLGSRSKLIRTSLSVRIFVCTLIVFISAVFTAPLSATVCPFCSAVALTFSEQLQKNDLAVVAKLIEIPPPNDDPDADFPKAKFEILKILKGKKFIAEGMTFKTQLVGSYPENQKFLVLGIDPPKVAWSTPMKASDRVFKYLERIQSLPEKGPDRLVFFQDYFEDDEPVLAFDAYDEFARAPYEDLIAMKDQMDHDKLIGWIKSKDTSVNRRRLYFTMLGVCGTKEDAKLLEELIKSGSRKKRAGLDALIACYLNLQGESGVDLIENTFIKDKEVDYVDTLQAVSALRFHGTEVDIVPKERIVAAIRQLLDRPKMADMIIPDLARWEDWSVMERLVQMFKEADADSNWLRVPVITYLRACPKDEAKAYIDELRKIDPEAVERADFFLGFEQEGDDWGDEDSESDSDNDSDDDVKEASEKKDADVDKKDDLTHVVHRVAYDTDSATETESAQSANDSESDIKRTFATQSDAENNQGPSASTETNSPVARIVPTDTNREPIAFVSSSNEPFQAPESSETQSLPIETPVAITTPYSMTMLIIFIPMAVSAVIFVLLWSVVNGWFERLIF